MSLTLKKNTISIFFTIHIADLTTKQGANFYKLKIWKRCNILTMAPPSPSISRALILPKCVILFKDVVVSNFFCDNCVTKKVTRMLINVLIKVNQRLTSPCFLLLVVELWMLIPWKPTTYTDSSLPYIVYCHLYLNIIIFKDVYVHLTLSFLVTINRVKLSSSYLKVYQHYFIIAPWDGCFLLLVIV